MEENQRIPIDRSKRHCDILCKMEGELVYVIKIKMINMFMVILRELGPHGYGTHGSLGLGAAVGGGRSA